MKILIKGLGVNRSFRSAYQSGVGKTTYLLLKHLGKIDNAKGVSFRYYTNGLSSLIYRRKDVLVDNFCWPVSQKFGNIKTKLEVIWRTTCLNYDILHIPHNIDAVSRNEKYIVTMHDVIEYLETSDTELRNKWEEMACNAHGIITCSEFSKSDIIRCFNVNPQKIKVIPWGIDRDIYKVLSNDKVQRVLNKFNVTTKYFFTCSCNHKRKNVEYALSAFEEYAKIVDDVSFVLSWNNPSEELTSRYEKLIQEKRIIFLPHVSDDELVALYNGAIATIYVSTYEGFGLPILESFACHTPVICSDCTSHPEVGGAIAQYVDIGNQSTMIKCMDRCSTKEFYDEFLKKIETHLLNFDWAKTAEEYMKYYETLLKLTR